jgi:hypothetical protein
MLVLYSCILSQQARAQGELPCIEVVNDQTSKFCQAIRDESMVDLLNDVSFPVTLCHSPDDEVVPSLLASLLPHDNPNVEGYVAPLVFLNVKGDHYEGANLCAIATIVRFRVTSLITPLDDPPSSCLAAVVDSENLALECTADTTFPPASLAAATPVAAPSYMPVYTSPTPGLIYDSAGYSQWTVSTGTTLLCLVPLSIFGILFL